MKKVFIVGFLFGLAACSSEKVLDSGKIIDIEYSQGKTFDLNHHVRIDSVIVLGFKDSLLLGQARNCRVESDRIVYDDYKQNKIFTFDMKGRLLHTIDALGNGPKEYNEVKDVIVSQDHKSILVLDETSILSFDLREGGFQKRQYLEFEHSRAFFRFINIGENDFYFWTTNDENSLYHYSTNTFKAIEKRSGFHFVTQKFYEYPDKSINFISDYGDTSISCLANDSLKMKFIFNFGENALPKSKIPTNYSEFEKIDEEPYFKCILNAFETDQWLYVKTVSPKMELYNIVYNKYNGKVYSGKQDDENPVIIVDTYKNMFVGILYPAYFTGDSELAKLVNRHADEEYEKPIMIFFDFK